MRWKAMHLPEGPYGLRNIEVYGTETNFGSDTNLFASYLGNRAHGLDLQLAIDLYSRDYGSRPVARATVRIYDYEYDRGKARDWLMDMCRVWAKE